MTIERIPVEVQTSEDERRSTRKTSIAPPRGMRPLRNDDGPATAHRAASDAPSRGLIIAAFFTIYIFWGSTYLAIRVAIYTIPPLLMAGMRFLTAGALMFAWARFKGAPPPTPRQWGSTALIGGLLLLGGNGALCWAEQRVPTGLAALIIATVPLWMMLLRWRIEGVRPSLPALFGLGLGFAGLVVLMAPSLHSGGGIDVVGALVVLLGAVSWALGSLAARWVELPAPTMATAMELLSGGAMLLVAGAAGGELTSVSRGTFTAHSVLAMAYLVIFGSIVAFSAYVWLLGVASPAVVSTYAYVNPIVAIGLGWLFLGEALSARILVAGAMTLVGVGFITISSAAKTDRAVLRTVEVAD